MIQARNDFRSHLSTLSEEFPEFRFIPVDPKGSTYSWDFKVRFLGKARVKEAKDKAQERADLMANRVRELFSDHDRDLAISFEPRIEGSKKISGAVFHYSSDRIVQREEAELVNYDSPEDFLNSMRRLRKNFPEFSFEPLGSDETESIWEMDVVLKKDVWKKPKKETLKRIAENLQFELDYLFPERSYRVNFDYDPELLKKKWILYKKWRYGSLQVRRSTDKNVDHIVKFKTQSRKSS